MNEIQQSQNSIPAAAQSKAGWGGIKSCQEMLSRVGIFYALDASETNLIISDLDTSLLDGSKFLEFQIKLLNCHA